MRFAGLRRGVRGARFGVCAGAAREVLTAEIAGLLYGIEVGVGK